MRAAMGYGAPMATVVFTNGHELMVTAGQRDILEAITAAQRGGSIDLPAGWIVLTPADDHREVSVQTAQIAYIRP